jgi:hypothetical protein
MEFNRMASDIAIPSTAGQFVSRWSATAETVNHRYTARDLEATRSSPLPAQCRLVSRGRQVRAGEIVIVVVWLVFHGA